MQRKSWRQIDPWLIIIALALVCYGLLVIRSATLLADRSVSRQLLTQGAYAVLALVAMAGMAVVDYRAVGAMWMVLYGGMIGLLALVDLLGVTSFGAQRWIGYGALSFQPSELAKLVVIVCLARYLATHEHEIHRPRVLITSFAMAALPVALIYQQPDLGTSLVLLAIWFGMTFAAGAPLRWLSVVMVVPLVGFPLVWQIMKEYMRRRLLTFMAPDRDPLGEGYNLIQARISIGSGGLWGRGLGNGTQTQLNFLRVQHSDFIFAVLGEELGFVGALLLLGLFAALLYRCMRVGQHSRDTFGKLLASGVAAMLLFQVFVNVGMNVGMLPVTGIPLPFISAGGSNLVTTFMGLGLLQSVLIHAQARRYDTRPNVRVPVTLRLRRERLALRWASAATRRTDSPARTAHAGGAR